jgi:leucyl/phenylalanyl-tRNA--protein transferase
MTQVDVQAAAAAGPSAAPSGAAPSGGGSAETAPGGGSPAPPRFNRELLVRKSRAFVNRVLDFSERQYHRALGQAAAVTKEGPIGGLCGLAAQFPFTSEQILLGYAQGMFPMEKRGSIYWHCPDPRCVVPLAQLHVPSRIKTYLRKKLFELHFDRDPVGVLSACGDRKNTWLTQRVQDAYKALFDLGAMHTVEAWQGDRLVGGAFGVALGTVFTVESMFSREDHASKLAFAHLCLYLAERGFTLVDCQYQQDHFERFGAINMPRDEYRNRIALGLLNPPTFRDGGSSGASSIDGAGR